MRLTVFIAGLIGLMAFSAAAAAPTKASFTLVGQTYTYSVPDGYCLPTDNSAAAVKAMAAERADTVNVTSAQFFNCADLNNPTGGLPHAGAIKTPKSSLIAAIPDRTVLLSQMKTALANGSLNAAVQSAKPMEQASSALSDSTGRKIVLTGAPKFVEVDDKAAYMTGVIDASAEGRQAKMAMASATTVSKGRLISCVFFGPYTSDADVTAALAMSKTEITRFIADNGG